MNKKLECYNGIEKIVNNSVTYIATEFRVPELEVWNKIYDYVLYENLEERDAIRKTLEDYEK